MNLAFALNSYNKAKVAKDIQSGDGYAAVKFALEQAIISMEKLNSGIIDEDKEHPAFMSGKKTFLFGFISFAVSAIKWTPHIIIISALVFEASIANAKESAEKSATPW